MSDSAHTIVSLAAAGALVGAVLALGTPRFDTNDDIHFLMLVTGALLGEPTGELIFSSSLLGNLLAFLYAQLPGVSWYEGLLVVAHLAVSAAGVFAFLPRTLRGLPVLLAAVAVLIFFETSLMLNLSFTSSAWALALAGLLLLAARAPDSTGRALLAGCLLGLGALLRERAALGALLVALPFLLLLRPRLRLTPLLTAGLVAASLLAAGRLADRLTYDDPEWRAFLDYNAVRSDLHATPRLPRRARGLTRLPEVGWSVAEFELFRSWFFIDPELYSLAHLEKLREITEDRVSGVSIPQVRARLADEVSHWKPFDYAVGLLLLTALLALAASRRDLGAAGLGVACAVGVSAYLAVALRFPPRIGLPLWLGVALFALVTGGRQGSEAGRPARRVAALGVAALLLLHAGVASGTRIRESRGGREAREAFELLDAFDRVDPDGVFVGAALRPWFLPFWSPELLRRVDLVPLGWGIHSPMYRRALARHGIGDLLDAIGTNPHLYLLVKRHVASALREYYWDRRGVDLELDPVATLHRPRRVTGVYRARILPAADSPRGPARAPVPID